MIPNGYSFGMSLAALFIPTTGDTHETQTQTKWLRHMIPNEACPWLMSYNDTDTDTDTDTQHFVGYVKCTRSAQGIL